MDPEVLSQLEAFLFQVLGHLEQETGRVPVVVALGSNLGRREHLVHGALTALAQILHRLVVGPWVVSEPWGPVPQARYLNTVALGFTTRSVWDLLRIFKALERRAGRAGGQRWGPRTLDLDLVFYGNLRMETPSLVVPHPRYRERPFVVEPLLHLLGAMGYWFEP